MLSIVTRRLKAGIAEPEQTSIAEQRLGNHVPATTNSNERIVASCKLLNTRRFVATNTFV
jgi:hypothetical protein